MESGPLSIMHRRRLGHTDVQRLYDAALAHVSLTALRAKTGLIVAIVSLVLAAVALVASYVPARRATRVDPMVALRTE